MRSSISHVYKLITSISTHFPLVTFFPFYSPVYLYLGARTGREGDDGGDLERLRREGGREGEREGREGREEV